MNATLNIALNDLRIFFAERGNLVGLVILPLAFTLVLGWAFGGGNSGPQRVRVDVIDEDGSPQSAQFLDDLRATNDTLVLCPMDNDDGDYCRLDGEPLFLEQAITRAQNEVSAALIVIPAGYAEALLNFGRAQIDFYAAGDVTLPNVVEQTVNAVLQDINTASLTAGATGALLDGFGEQTGLSTLLAGLRDTLVSRIYAEAQQRIEARPAAVRYVLTEGEADEQVDQGFGQSVPGMGSMYVMFTVLGGMAVLGVLRQFYAFRELNIVSKIEAGEYALQQLPRRWHRLIQEAINLRQHSSASLYRFHITRAIEALRFLRYVIALCNSSLR